MVVILLVEFLVIIVWLVVVIGVYWVDKFTIDSILACALKEKLTCVLFFLLLF